MPSDRRLYTIVFSTSAALNYRTEPLQSDMFVGPRVKQTAASFKLLMDIVTTTCTVSRFRLLKQIVVNTKYVHCVFCRCCSRCCAQCKSWRLWMWVVFVVPPAQVPPPSTSRHCDWAPTAHVKCDRACSYFSYCLRDGSDNITFHHMRYLTKYHIVHYVCNVQIIIDVTHTHTSTQVHSLSYRYVALRKMSTKWAQLYGPAACDAHYSFHMLI